MSVYVIIFMQGVLSTEIFYFKETMKSLMFCISLFISETNLFISYTIFLILSLFPAHETQGNFTS